MIEREDNLEISSNQFNTNPSTPSSRRKGGLLTMPFIIVNEIFEKLASYGLLPNMIFYLMKDYQMSIANATSILLLWSSLTHFTPVLGALLSDSYLGRFKTIATGSLSSLLVSSFLFLVLLSFGIGIISAWSQRFQPLHLHYIETCFRLISMFCISQGLVKGVSLLWLTTMIPNVKPLPGELPHSGHLALLYLSFLLMSIGAGGIRPCSMAFGADQLVNEKYNRKNNRVLQSYFSWYYVSIGFSILTATIVIVYVQEHHGWRLGFGIPSILMLISVSSFYMGSSLYVKVIPDNSLFTGLARVIVISFKNRSIPFSEYDLYYCTNECIYAVPSHRLRFLNKACIVKDPGNDMNLDGSIAKPWNLCSVDHVEALKSLITILPIWSTGIIMYMILTQVTFPVIQASTMNRHLTSNFQVPAASFIVFYVLTLTVWIIVYDRVAVPLLKRLTGKPRGISNVLRMGIGLLISSIAMVAAAIVEIMRRRRAVQGKAGEMSAFWLVLQYSLGGLADALNAIGQIEFYFSQLPESMASFPMALNSALAGLLGSSVVKAVDKVTQQDGKTSWVANDPNKGHYDYFYWLLAIMCAANFLYFLLCAWVLRLSKDVKPKLSEKQCVV